MSTAFSYAQAAKGKLSTPSAPQSVTSQAASTTSNQNSDAAAATGPSTVPQSSAPSTVSNDQDTKDNSLQPVVQSEAVNKSESALDQTAQGSESAGKTAETEDTVPTTSEKRQANEAPVERRAKGPPARSSDTPDSRKTRKGKKARAADKESEQEQAAEKEKEPEAPKVQLSEAPIPTVNPWLQRAQTKPTQPAPVRTAAGPSAHQAKSSINDNDQSTRSPLNGVKGQKKDARDNGDQVSRRHAPRGSRVVEKAATESLPSVADAASWPTPENAATEIKSSETAVKPENDEVQDEKSESGPKDKPKWVAIPFVPSAVFETPLPSRNPRGSKTGATRGGREAGVRGSAGSANAVDRQQATGTPRSSGERGAENVNGVRASSVSSPAAKRALADTFASRDVRKEVGYKEATNGPLTAQVNGAEDAVKLAESGTKDDVSSQQHGSFEAPGTEKHAGSRPDPSRESFTPAAKENGTHHHPTKSEKRNGRGRGGHPGANGHRAHGAYPPNGQAYQGPGNMGSRQNSYPGNMSMGYGMSGAGAANGHPTRNSTSGSFYRSNGRNSRGLPMQSAPTWNMDPSMHQMQAMPPQPFSYEHSILTMLTRQLSYYFSVNNLLKDSYLRRCMDSQGYVFLDVIMAFSRIQQLTNDPQLVRLACMDCPDVELVTGMEDHRDRIRRVKGWNEFVYPQGSRNEEVNYDDGPANVYKHERMFVNQFVPLYQVESPGFYPPQGFPSWGNDGFQQHNMTNGVNGHPPQKGETQLSAEVPDFSPNGGSSASDAEQNALKAAAHTNGKDHQSNGVESTLTNGTSDNVAAPYTNGVSASVEGVSH